MRYARNFSVATLSMLAMLPVAAAQQPVGPYRPASPTLSPYLYLTQPSNGIFPNYQAYVQPLQAQQQTNQVQQLQISQLQGQQQQEQQQQLRHILQPKVAPTGITASFNSLSHYYPVSNSNTKKGGKR
jgi:hypothetical protein